MNDDLLVIVKKMYNWEMEGFSIQTLSEAITKDKRFEPKSLFHDFSFSFIQWENEQSHC